LCHGVFLVGKEGPSPSLAELRLAGVTAISQRFQTVFMNFDPLDRSEQCSPLMSSTANDNMNASKVVDCQLMLIGLHAVDSLLGVALLGLGE